MADTCAIRGAMYDGRMVKPVLLSGTPFNLHSPADDDRYFSALRDNMEDQLASICRHLLPEKAGIWDIGANIGVTALTMAALNPDWQIVAVEGGPALHETLQRNIRENGRAAQIRPVHAAVGEIDGEVSFYEHSAFGHIASRPAEFEEAMMVRMISPATLQREFGLPSINFVKIDIEGFEFPFLRAGLGLFQQHRSIICMEFNMWCLMYYGRTLPTEFMEWIVQNFADVRLLQHQGFTAQRVTADKPLFLHDLGYHIMTRMEGICNLLLCSEEGQISLPLTHAPSADAAPRIKSAHRESGEDDKIKGRCDR
jgi:FkbM family methyltransferase